MGCPPGGGFRFAGLALPGVAAGLEREVEAAAFEVAALGADDHVDDDCGVVDAAGVDGGSILAEAADEFGADGAVAAGGGLAAGPVGPVGGAGVVGRGRPVRWEEWLPGAEFGLGKDVALGKDVDCGIGLGAGGDDGVAEKEVATEGVAAVGAVADGEGFVGADDAVGEGVGERRRGRRPGVRIRTSRRRRRR